MTYELVILGGGESGTGAALLARQKGINVFLSDRGILKNQYRDQLINANIDFEEEKHSESIILSASEIIISPGIPDSAPIIRLAHEKGILTIDEIEFAYRYTSAKIIAITGSNGKTTTTELLFHLLKKAGLSVGIGGNIGRSFARQLCEIDYDFWVLELSSFQLDRIEKLRPYISILLNITPDHLDRYQYKFENYVASKFRITKNQHSTDYFIYCADDNTITEQIQTGQIKAQMLPFSLNKPVNPGAYISENNITINNNHNSLIMNIYDLALQGKHNAYNSMAAAIAGNVLKIRKDIIRESLSDFQGVEHRLEYFLKVHGIDFINDSKATNVNSTWYALESISSPIIWIVGGIDKGNDYSELFDLVKKKVKSIICLGSDNSKLLQTFDGMVEIIADTKSMEEAVNLSYTLGNKGDSVLLSPACASFDLFENYEHRGRAFKKAVRDL